MKSGNQLLIDYVSYNDIAQATVSLESGIDPNFLVDKKKPLLFLAKSPEMVTLLMDYGVNPGVREINDLGNDEFNPTFLKNVWIKYNNYGDRVNRCKIISAIVNHPLCFISNKIINETLITLLDEYIKISKQTLHPVKKELTGAIKSLIKISGNLQKNMEVFFFNQALAFDGRPAQFVISRDRTDLIDVMLKNNYLFWVDCKNRKVNFFPSYLIPIIKDDSYYSKSEHQKKIDSYFTNLELSKFIAKYPLVKEFAKYLPMDVAHIILRLLFLLGNKKNQMQPYIDYFARNKFLLARKEVFFQIYNFLNKYADGFHTFYNNEKLSGRDFFVNAGEHATVEKDGLTAKTLRLLCDHDRFFKKNPTQFMQALSERTKELAEKKKNSLVFFPFPQKKLDANEKNAIEKDIEKSWSIKY